jgi:abortive infection bacteriophage resistance protein
MRSLKPWRSFDSQLDQLIDRGLQVSDRVAALAYLKRIGYYRLSGYWYPLRQIDLAVSAARGTPVRMDQFLLGSRFARVLSFTFA